MRTLDSNRKRCFRTALRRTTSTKRPGSNHDLILPQCWLRTLVLSLKPTMLLTTALIPIKRASHQYVGCHASFAS